MIRILSCCVSLLLTQKQANASDDALQNSLRGSTGTFQSFLKNTVKESGDCPVFDKIATALEEKHMFMDAVKPCGYYFNQGCNFQVIHSDVCYPGEGPGDIHTFMPYIVQFDIGLHPLARARGAYTDAEAGQKDWCIGCPETDFFLGSSVTKETSGETCVEIIVKAGDSGDDATVGGCAGKCGAGCNGAGWAVDCLKHDTCVTYKKWVLDTTWPQTGHMPFGFCNDLDCGDEGAQTTLNCYEDRWFNERSIVCNKDGFANNRNFYGHWSWASTFFPAGTCERFQDWDAGQGIPDNDRISNPYNLMAEAEVQE